MSDLVKIVLTACVTLVGGVILLVATQIFTRFVVDPLVDFRRLLGEVSHTLVFHANCLHNPVTMASTPEFADARRQCRMLASRLRSFSAAVPLYSFLACIHLVPPLSNVYDASSNLIGLSNTMANSPETWATNYYERIRKALKIRVD